MLYAILAVLLAGVFLYALHYGYKLAFWYEDSLREAYVYGNSQI